MLRQVLASLRNCARHTPPNQVIREAMRQVHVKLIEEAVAELSIRANTVLRKDVLSQLSAARKKETNSQAKKIFEALLKNAALARQRKLAICQDTGLPVVFVELGQDIRIKGGGLKQAINKGIGSGYRQGFLRKSIVRHPLKRTPAGYTPAVIHADVVPGDRVKICLLPKGFGCENKARVRMFKPTAGLGEIKEFIVRTVKDAGADACPPYIVGVGIGGTQDYACLLAKKALLKKVTGYISELERDLLKDINRLRIGPMGLGGKTTCLGVNIETFPTHIAGLPVAVNISCHALRSAAKII